MSEEEEDCTCTACGGYTTNRAISLCGWSYLCSDCRDEEMESGHYDDDGIWCNFYDSYESNDD